MTPAPAAPRLSCLTVVVSLVLAGGVIALLRGRASDSLPWFAYAAAVLTALAVFAVERRVTGYVWGVAAAALMAVHPALRQPASGWSGVLADALVVATLAATAIAWQLTFLPDFAWRGWPVLIVVMGSAIGLAWAGDTRAGILAALLGCGGTWLAAGLARGLRARKPEVVPGLGNMLMAGLAGIAAPALGVAVYRFMDSSVGSSAHFWSPLLTALRDSSHAEEGVTALDRLQVWLWPTPWVVLPLLAWSLWRTARRGWKEWKRQTPPFSWLLTFAALAMPSVLWFWPPRDGGRAPLVVSALLVLLGVFLVADALRSFARRLMLPPPQERALEVAESDGVTA